MNFRLATPDDLPEIKEMYTKLIERMNQDGIAVWDNVYPCNSFADDIESNNLYILLINNIIVGAFSLCNSNNGEGHVKWQNQSAKAIYIDRLGVNTDYSKQGIATELLNFAAEVAKEKTAEYLRLFVIDINRPAINLYEKSGFIKAEGTYLEVIDKTLSFKEYGFEKRL